MALNAKSVASGARFVGMGFSLGATVIATIWLGDWVDRYLGTSPLFLLAFLFAGLYGFTRRLLWMVERRGERRRAEKGPTGG